MSDAPPALITLPSRRRRVVVAMSGGVDSSVAAALLAREGHDVIGITLQLYDQGGAAARKGACCAGQDIHDARNVAAALGIPHYVLDYEARFREAVIDAFADRYLAGETPIPCVACNQTVKFRDLLDTARELGADSMATGHYITLRQGANGPELYRAADRQRDQSYFLYATTVAQLQRLAFPLGALTKPEVRRLAADFGLPVAEKPDSQDICFVPEGRYAGVIARLMPEAVAGGDIVHVDGRRLGRHDGIQNFTVGQRRGLGLATGEPLYVVRIEPARHEVVVGPRESLLTTELRLRSVNWIGGARLAEAARSGDLTIHARIRSTQEPGPALLTLGPDDTAQVRLVDGVLGVARGQACVFYADASSNARVLGGGTIDATTGPAIEAGSPAAAPAGLA